MLYFLKVSHLISGMPLKLSCGTWIQLLGLSMDFLLLLFCFQWNGKNYPAARSWLPITVMPECLITFYADRSFKFQLWMQSVINVFCFYGNWAAQAFGLPFLSPYLQSIDSDFRHGANYASNAGTVLKPNTSQYVTGISPFYLGVQYKQMLDFKVRVLDLLSKGIPLLRFYFWLVGKIVIRNNPKYGRL